MFWKPWARSMVIFLSALERSGLNLNWLPELKSMSQGCPFTAVLSPVSRLVLAKLKKDGAFLQYVHNLMLLLNQK